MGEIKDEINWEHFLDNYFDLFQPAIKKDQYKNGLAITYQKNDIYIWCDLSIDRLTINKLEFGRMTFDGNGNEQSNWVKGVFINDEHLYMTFLQTSFDSEYFDRKNNYTLKFDTLKKISFRAFLIFHVLKGGQKKSSVLTIMLSIKLSYLQIIITGQ